MGKKARKKQNKFVSCITMPFRLYGKAKEFYTKSMVNFAARIGHGSGVAFCHGSNPYYHYQYQMKDMTDDKDLRELACALSMNKISGSDEAKRDSCVGVGKIGRIDEDKSCDFQEIKVRTDIFDIVKHPRQRCCPLKKKEHSLGLPSKSKSPST